MDTLNYNEMLLTGTSEVFSYPASCISYYKFKG